MNAGGLYGKARPENFPTVNDYRNPIVAGALKNLGYVNMFNRGVRRVKELFEENGNPPVQFNVDKITVFEVVAKAATQIIGTKSKWDQVKMGPSQKENLLQVRPSATRCWNIVLPHVLCHQFCSIWVIRIDRSSAISILSQ
jgi:predicted HTH transcriptional regulator